MQIRTVGALLFLALPFFTSLGAPSVWDSNEAYYVQTPREMVDRGDWVVPHFNGKPRLNKPPLSYWLVAPFYYWFGDALWWERLIMAVLAYGCVWLVFWMGRILFCELTGLLAAGLFATSLRFLMLSRRLLIDILLLFCVLAAVAFLLRWWKQGDRRSFLLASLFLGLGFLSKGPVAFLPAAAVVLYLLVSDQRSRLRSAPWIPAMLILISVSGSWFLVLGFRMGWDTVGHFLWTENLGRFTHIPFGPERGHFFYLGAFLTDYFPWALFFLGALFDWTRSRWNVRARAPLTANSSRPGETDSAGDKATLELLGCWILLYLVIFSFSQNKQEYYILPVYPAASLWLAHHLRRVSPSLAARLLVAGVSTILGLLFFVLAYSLFAEAWGWWLPFVAFAVFIWVTAKGQIERMIWCLCLFYFLVFSLHLSPLDDYRPVHHLARTIQKRTSGQAYLAGYYRYSAPSLAYYLNRPILETYRYQETVDALRARSPAYIIIESHDYEELRQAVGERLEIVEVRPKLYTNGRTLISGLKSGRNIDPDAWTRPIYLVSNQSQ